ncbi:hypothetical protein [Shimia abyssi]|uniref:Uncharacterized protein n=1 Tax=Shimia abyssi TaxID=1662395 RepID=A0A2P8FE65_9RHOB|nr:hypothetical protein [Shimia abyssi]PSL20016.1 hypothetical protein CLV88_10475 [Shimia abyssi]
MNRVAILATPFVLVSVGSAASGDFHTRTGVRVYPVNEQIFEVAALPGETQIEDFWCGAGDYAKRVLGAEDRDKVYVVSEAGPGVVADSRSTVQFSLSPPEQTEGALGNRTYWGPNIGASNSVVEAIHECRTKQKRDL